MKFKATSLVCTALAVLGGARAQADIWVSSSELLERIDTQGNVVDTVTGAFGQPFHVEAPREGIVAGQVDPRDGSVVVMEHGPRDMQPRLGRLIKLSPTGEAVWQHLFTFPSLNRYPLPSMSVGEACGSHCPGLGSCSSTTKPAP